MMASQMKAGFTVHHRLALMPEEDSFAANPDGTILVIADGITRDPLGMPVLPNRTDTVANAQSLRDYPNPFQMLEFFWKYPRPSPARRAADTFCATMLTSLTEQDRVDAARMAGAFGDANRAIANLNAAGNPDADYLENDFWACVASAAAVRRERDRRVLVYGFITDCGVAVFGADGQIVFHTPNEIATRFKSTAEERAGTGFRYPEGRRTTRRDFRNNPDNADAFGALTGEAAAMHYVRTGEIDVEADQVVVVYTDGLEHVVFMPAFQDAVCRRDVRAMQRVCRRRVITEGSLVCAAVDRGERAVAD